MICHCPSRVNLNSSSSHGLGLFSCASCPTRQCSFHHPRSSGLCTGHASLSNLRHPAYFLSKVLASFILLRFFCAFFELLHVLRGFPSLSFFRPALPPSQTTCLNFPKFRFCFHNHPVCSCISDSFSHVLNLFSHTHTQHPSSSDRATPFDLFDSSHCSMCPLSFFEKISACNLRFASIVSACVLLQMRLFLVSAFVYVTFS